MPSSLSQPYTVTIRQFSKHTTKQASIPYLSLTSMPFRPSPGKTECPYRLDPANRYDIAHFRRIPEWRRRFPTLYPRTWPEHPPRSHVFVAYLFGPVGMVAINVFFLAGAWMYIEKGGGRECTDFFDSEKDLDPRRRWQGQHDSSSNSTVEVAMAPLRNVSNQTHSRSTYPFELQQEIAHLRLLWNLLQPVLWPDSFIATVLQSSGIPASSE